MDMWKLFDLGFSGPYFALSNKMKGLTHVKERLDKAIGNIEWRLRFPEGSFSTLTVGGSDHSLILFF